MYIYFWLESRDPFCTYDVFNNVDVGINAVVKKIENKHTLLIKYNYTILLY